MVQLIFCIVFMFFYNYRFVFGKNEVVELSFLKRPFHKSIVSKRSFKKIIVSKTEIG